MNAAVRTGSGIAFGRHPRLVDVVIAFEDEFDIEIADEDVDSVNSVGDAVNLILGKL